MLKILFAIFVAHCNVSVEYFVFSIVKLVYFFAVFYCLLFLPDVCLVNKVVHNVLTHKKPPKVGQCHVQM